MSVHRFTPLLLLAFTGCVGMIYADAMRQATTPTPVVPAAQAPAPPPGEGWYCYDIHTYDNESHSTSTSDVCLRTLDSCQGAAARERPGSHKSLTTGSCVAQESAACTYFWNTMGSGQWDCMRELPSCSRKQGAPAGDAVAKQSECAVYK